MIKKEVIK